VFRQQLISYYGDKVPSQIIQSFNNGIFLWDDQKTEVYEMCPACEHL